MHRRCAMLVVVLVLLFTFRPSSSGQGASTPPAIDGKVLVESVGISGTEAMDSVAVAKIADSMAGSTFRNDPEELEERIRAKFQDQGYFKVQIEKFDIKVIDPLASPKPVRLEARVSEGPLCKVSSIRFTGNHAFGNEALRAKFPLKTGDPFQRSKVVGALEAIRSLYGPQGFLNLTLIPETALDSSSGVKLTIEVEEGPQYHMNKLAIFGPSEIAGNLAPRWELAPGMVFDPSYVKRFLDQNASALPFDFREESVTIIEDCPNAMVDVHLHFVEDGQHLLSDQAQRVNCEQPTDKE